MIMKKMRDFFNEIRSEWKRLYSKALAGEERIIEIELWSWGEEGINNDEDRAWALIKYLYKKILINDENWHFFYENKYNIIRCSESFFQPVLDELKMFGVVYKVKGEWIDGSRTVEAHKKIYQGLFHYFTLMALEEYEDDDIYHIYDRLSHCFLNHQFYALKGFREKQGKQWEARLMSMTAVQRADYNGYLGAHGIDASKSNPDKVEESEEDEEEGVE